MFDLRRFVAAQNDQDTFARAVAELERGRKAGHWMWFVFPQIAGLGLSLTSRRYALAGLPEARAYLADPVLGPRLQRCAALVAATTDRTAEQIFGGIDATKLRSSMTLFARAAPDEPVFRAVLDKFFDGEQDPETLLRL